MAFIRWEQLGELVTNREPASRLAPTRASGWAPTVDLYETRDRFILQAELSGLRREDVQISVENDRLRVWGQRPEPAFRAEQYHQIERGYGAFSRTFSFPHVVDAGAIKADMRAGVLTVTIPKAASAVTRRVEVT